MNEMLDNWTVEWMHGLGQGGALCVCEKLKEGGVDLVSSMLLATFPYKTRFCTIKLDIG